MSPSEQRRFLRIEIARETGWSLQYIDSLSMADIGDYVAVKDAVQRGNEKLRKSKGGKKGKR